MNLKKVCLALLVSTMFFFSNNARAQEIVSIRNQCIALISSYGTQGDIDKLERVINIALDSGMTVNEVKEVIVQMYAFSGLPKSINSANAFIRVMNSRKDKKDKIGTSVKFLPRDVDRYVYGTKMQNDLNKNTKKAQNISHTPTLDTIVKEHIFADLYSREVLTIKEREIAAIGALSAIDDAGALLDEHIAMAKNAGLSDSTIEELLDILKYTKGGIFGLGDLNKYYAKYFKGKSYIKTLSSQGVYISSITFEPKARNNWHIHNDAGQVLLITSGRGYYQEEGKEPRELLPGDVVNVPAGVKHWHGAAPDSWFTYISIADSTKATTTDWFESVSDSEYNKLK